MSKPNKHLAILSELRAGLDVGLTGSMKPNLAITKGPWQVVVSGHGTAVKGAPQSEGSVIRFPVAWQIHNEADARLIAAAPDMFEALEKLVAAAIVAGKHTDVGGGALRYAINKADDALRKAEGGQ